MDYYYKKAGAIFNAHSYWTKQPVDVIKEFITKYSNEGDMVLDPFCGSGMTGVAAIQTNRRYLLSDISPICLHIAKGYCLNFSDFDVEKVIQDLTTCLLPLYEVSCPDCGTLCQIDYTVLEDKLESEHRLEAQSIVFHCPQCKKKIRKAPDADDLSKQESALYENLFYPKDFFFGDEPKRNYKRGIKQVYQLYSRRNLSALSLLLHNIKNLKDENLRQLCLFAFTSILFNCSIMSRYNPKYENTQIKMGTYYVPQFIKDNSVVFSFARKMRSVVKAKKEIYSSPYNYSGDVLYSSATDLSHIPDNSIDYLYTDPPYSDKISYAELNIVFESWLGNGCTNTDNEMIVTKSGNKGIAEYATMFSSFLSEAYRVLKPQSKLTIIFHNSSLEHWAYFQDVLLKSGFIPVNPNELVRLISNSKTSTQYQSERNSQCFLAFTLMKDDGHKSNLIDLNDAEYVKLINTLRQEAASLGFEAKCDQYDFIINKLLFKYKIKNHIVI